MPAGGLSMKFACESCGARYTLDDARVSGRILRIRCKACESIMTVRGNDVRVEPHAVETPSVGFSRRATASYAAVSKPAAPEIDPSEAWFYALHGQTYGPYTQHELGERLRDGRVEADAYVWIQSFADWQPAREVEPFATAIRGRRGSSPAGLKTIQLSADDLVALRADVNATAEAVAHEVQRERAPDDAASRVAALEAAARAAAEREAAEAAARAAAEREAAEAAARAAAEREAAEAAARAAAEREAAEAAARAAAEREAAEAAARAAAEREAAEAAARAAAERDEAEAAERAAALRESLAARRPAAKAEPPRDLPRGRPLPMPGSGAFPSVGGRSPAVPPPRPTPISVVPSPQRPLRDLLAELSGDSPAVALNAAADDAPDAALVDQLDENELIAGEPEAAPAPDVAALAIDEVVEAVAPDAPPSQATDEPAAAPVADAADSDEPTPARGTAPVAAPVDETPAEAEAAPIDAAPTEAVAAPAAAPDAAAAVATRAESRPASARPNVEAKVEPKAAPAPIVGYATTGSLPALPARRRPMAVYAIVAIVLICVGAAIAVSRSRKATPTSGATLEAPAGPAVAAPTAANRLPTATEERIARQNRDAAFARAADRAGRALSEARAALPAAEGSGAAVPAVAAPTTAGSGPRRPSEAAEAPAAAIATTATAGTVTGTQGLYGRLADERLAGPGAAVPTTATTATTAGPSSEHFAEGLRSFVQDSVQRCNQRHIAEEGAMTESRISLELVVQPSGRVSSVTAPRDLSGTAFDACLQSHRERWLFDRFEGEAVTLQKAYVLQ
jgi:hypothetical protein